MNDKKLYVTNPCKSSILNLMIIACIAVFGSCERGGARSRQITVVDTSSATDITKTYQEIGFFGDIKKEQWPQFVRAVQNNIGRSKKEEGNLAFSLYQPEDGKLQPIWFERYRDTATHNAHMVQNYFKNAIQVIQRSLRGKARSIYLKELSEIPAKVANLSDKPGPTRYVIVLFDVKPEKRRVFVNMMIRLAKRSRREPGNMEFNIYRYAENANKFVVLEGWQTRAYQEAQMKQPYIKQLGITMKNFFVTNPIDSRWLVKDISQ